MFFQQSGTVNAITRWILSRTRARDNASEYPKSHVKVLFKFSSTAGLVQEPASQSASAICSREADRHKLGVGRSEDVEQSEEEDWEQQSIVGQLLKSHGRKYFSSS